MIKRDETVTLEMTSLVKSIEKQLQDKIAVSLRATNDAQIKNQEQFTALQKVIDKMMATQKDKASEVDNVHRKMRQLQSETD